MINVHHIFLKGIIFIITYINTSTYISYVGIMTPAVQYAQNFQIRNQLFPYKNLGRNLLLVDKDRILNFNIL